MKTRQTKKLEKEVVDLHREVDRLKQVHREYLRLHNDIPEKIAGVLRRIKTLISQTPKP